MNLSRGLFKYGLYLLIGGWMFVLGVVVGRGTSPVTFDTSSFQERLKVIVGKIPEQAPAAEKVDLDFYEALNKPVPQDTVISALPGKNQADSAAGDKKNTSPGKNGLTTAVPEDPGPEEDIPVKLSRKRATYVSSLDVKDSGAKNANRTEDQDSPSVKQAGSEKKTAAKPVPNEALASAKDGQYTIQVAAYRAFKDAVSQMSLLEKAGFSSYRTKAEANGTTWYRVRTGVFEDFSSAQAELDRLKQAKINGMIIKKEDQ